MSGSLFNECDDKQMQKLIKAHGPHRFSRLENIRRAVIHNFDRITRK
jgi:hypothetical protein